MTIKKSNVKPASQQSTLAKQQGKASSQTLLFSVIAVLLVLGIAWVIYSITQPVEFDALPVSELTVEQYTEPEPELTLPTQVRKPQAKVPDTVPVETSSSLSFCAAPDVEIVGFDWNSRQAKSKTQSLNWIEVTNQNLLSSAQFQNYKEQNARKIYGGNTRQSASQVAMQKLMNDPEFARTLMGESRSGLMKTEALEKFAGDEKFLLQTLKFNPFDLTVEEFDKLLDSYPSFSFTYVYDLLSNSFGMEADFVSAIMDKLDLSTRASLPEDYTGAKLASSLLSDAQFDLFLLVNRLALPIEEDMKSTLYFAYGNGLSYEQFDEDVSSQVFARLIDTVGKPSPDDVLMIAQAKRENPKDAFIRYGIDIESYLKYPLNQDVIDMDRKALNKRLQEIKDSWPNYIMRINPNSECRNETDFHWDDKTLIAWLNEKITEPNNMQEVDAELVKISRLYVERARNLYINRKLDVIYPQFDFQEDREFEKRLYKALGNAGDAGSEEQISLADLFTESLTEDQERLVKVLLVSMITNPKLMDDSINLGLSYDDSDMLNALRFQNTVAAKWLKAMGIGYGGTDEFGNGVLYWLTLFGAYDAIKGIDNNSIPKLYNPANLNPHELHYAACQDYGSVPSIIMEFEIGKDLKQQMKTELCEQVSGYTAFMNQLGE